MRTRKCPNCGQAIEGQRQFVLHLLKEAGPRGVHTFELRALFIGNPSQRIDELETAGHRITHQRERFRGDATGTRYILRDLSGVGDCPAPPAAPETPSPADVNPAEAGAAGTLFDPADGRRTLGAYDDAEAA